MSTNVFDLIAAACTPSTELRSPSSGNSVPMQTVIDYAASYAATGPLAAQDGSQRIGLLAQNGPDWVAAILAILAAGDTCVPLPMPVAFTSTDHYVDHLVRVIGDAEISLLLTDSTDDQIPTDRIASAVEIAEVTDVLQTPPTGEVPEHRPQLSSGTEAVIQYTSGSTSRPKGVVLTHGNVTAGITGIARTIGWTPSDVMGLWLPLFHDMGLFSLLAALSQGSTVCLWTPHDFVRRPIAWLSEFAAAGATATPAPNFFYDLLTLAAIRKGIPEDLDLSSWRLATNGAEPIQARTLDAFETIFAEHGVAPELVRPNYGMAEATLIVSFARPDAPRTVHQVARESIRNDEPVVLVDTPGPATRAVVGCGTAAHGIRLRVVGANATPLPDYHVGEIQICGQAVTHGYRGVAPEAQPFAADGWLKTGDLGYLSDGELFVVGRIKSMIVVNGKNYYAEDVEEIVRITPGVNGRRAAAFTVATGDTEKMGIVWESKYSGDETRRISSSIRDTLSSRLGLNATAVVGVAPGSIPFTSSGKVKRSAARTTFISQF